MDESDRLRAMITKWCPATCHHEPFQVQVIRAFMQACACVADQDRVIRGERPMIPLDSYPDKALT